MASFLEAFQVGSGIAEKGLESYERARAWQEKLQEHAEAVGLEKQKMAAAAAKERYAEFEKGVADDRALGKQSFEQQAKKQELAIQHTRAQAEDTRAAAYKLKEESDASRRSHDESKLNTLSPKDYLGLLHGRYQDSAKSYAWAKENDPENAPLYKAKMDQHSAEYDLAMKKAQSAIEKRNPLGR